MGGALGERGEGRGLIDASLLGGGVCRELAHACASSLLASRLLEKGGRKGESVGHVDSPKGRVIESEAR